MQINKILKDNLERNNNNIQKIYKIKDYNNNDKMLI